MKTKSAQGMVEFISPAVQAAYKVAAFQALTGGIYHSIINLWIDPKKRLSNPPGVISFLYFLKIPNDSFLGDSWFQGKAVASSYPDNKNSKIEETLWPERVLGVRRWLPRQGLVFKVDKIATQTIQFDANLVAAFCLVTLTMWSLSRWVPSASDDMNLSHSPLLHALGVLFVSEELGRTQRREHLKNIEAIARWKYVVPPVTIVVAIGSGVRGLTFFLLVLLVRYVCDTGRMMVRAVFSNEWLGQGSSTLRGSVRMMCASILLPLIVALSMTMCMFCQRQV